MEYIADLSEDPFTGVIAGQSCGHTADLPDPDSMMGFNKMAYALYEETGKYPGIIAVDYGHNRLYTPAELSAANQVLIDFWNDGGMVAVGWSPLNPWLNDELDIEGNPGDWHDTRTTYLSEEQREQIDLDLLIDSGEEINIVWRRKLDRIAAAIQELEEAGVVIMFKPIQEPNGEWFWWGIDSHRDDPSPYINLYRDMYTYFTDEKGLDNILWLYAPNRNQEQLGYWCFEQMWIYPGNDYVDILSPTSYTDAGDVYDYEEFVATGKPLGMAEYGPHHDDNVGEFDDLTYVRRISTDYTGMAFWISWHDWDNGDGTNTYMSIIGNRNANALMNHELVITRDELELEL